MSGRWQRLRDEHLSTPEARERYAKARKDLEAELVAAGKWMCPRCRDWIGPEDELGSPPVCDMCKLAGRIADDHWLSGDES